jgi:uncharacterized protein (DUF433 family)
VIITQLSAESINLPSSFTIVKSKNPEILLDLYLFNVILKVLNNGKDVILMTFLFDRITFSREIMGGQACIRDIRVPVSLIVNMIANGATFSEVLDDYEYLEEEDIKQALKYASWAVSDQVYAI